ncbi:MAG: glycosyltransferase family 4 protein [Undibacterium sp.]
MRIGIDARFYGSLGKGLGRYTEKLITQLERLDDAVEYVIFLRRENFDEYQPKSRRFKKILADYPWYGWREQILFPRLLKEQRLDLIHFPHFNVPFLVRIPFIVTIHDLILLHYPTVKASELPPFLYWLKYIVYRFVISAAVRRARAIITVSRFTETDLETAYPVARGKVTVTLEAADDFCHWIHPTKEQAFLESLELCEFDQTPGVTRLKPFVLYVGNAYPHKNLGLIIKLAKHFPELTFLCVGKEDFFYRTFHHEVESAGCNNIRLVGYVDDRSLGSLYRRASAYIFPSLYEGFGLPGLEAMTYGTPVVAARAGSLPEIYAEAAYFFEPDSLPSCSRALESALDESDLVSEQQRTIRFHQADRFSWEPMARETRELYETVR